MRTVALAVADGHTRAESFSPSFLPRLPSGRRSRARRIGPRRGAWIPRRRGWCCSRRASPRSRGSPPTWPARRSRRTRGRWPASPGVTDGEPFSACRPDNVAFKNLVSELGAALAPSTMHGARTVGFGGFVLSLEAAYTSINADGATHAQRGHRLPGGGAVLAPGDAGVDGRERELQHREQQPGLDDRRLHAHGPQGAPLRLRARRGARLRVEHVALDARRGRALGAPGRVSHRVPGVRAGHRHRLRASAR